MTGAGAGCLVMAKPGGARCNLGCAYCYYLGKAALWPAEPAPRMTDDLLERFIRERLATYPEPEVPFEWHGGEPTLLGLDFYRRVVELQRRHLPPGRRARNGIQTNGTLLDDAWARFLRDEGFTVGLSLDGPAAAHDRYRLGPGGAPSHARAEAAFRLLRRYGVPCDVLCVLHAGNVGDPQGTYGYFRDLGATYLQFLPLVQPAGAGVSAATPAPGAVGAFLCAVFDRWIRQDVGRIGVQLFDEALRPALGLEHALCLFRETCGEALVLEHDGGVYACDHFVDPEHRLGSLGERPLGDLAALPAQAAFGAAKRDRLPGRCRTCDVLAWCHGGCPKDRIVVDRRGERNNYLCPAYQRFFRHCRPALGRLAVRLTSRDRSGRGQNGTGEGLLKI